MVECVDGAKVNGENWGAKRQKALAGWDGDASRRWHTDLAYYYPVLQAAGQGFETEFQFWEAVAVGIFCSKAKRKVSECTSRERQKWLQHSPERTKVLPWVAWGWARTGRAPYKQSAGLLLVKLLQPPTWLPGW